MTRVAQDQLAFSSGEVSPLLRTRVDYQRFKTGLASCVGFIPLRQGGVTRAPGTLFRGYTRNNQKARLIAFEFAKNDTLILELTPGFMRVWRYGKLVTAAGGAVYEMAHPYTAADLENLQWVQSADVIYLASGNRPIQRLARYALDNWSIAAAPVRNGPFRLQNLDETLKITPSGATGSINLTASKAVFKSGHVGSLMRLEPVSYSDIPLWTGNTDASLGQKMRYGGRIYELVKGDKTGVNPPVHTEGVERVGLDPEVSWRFVSDGVGIVRITAFGSSTSVTATVIRALPPNLISEATYRWSEAAWSAIYGYPRCVEIFDQRLIAASTTSDPRTVWFSVIGDYEDFEPGTEADASFGYTISGGSSQNRIIWVKSGRGGLHIGALGEEYSARRDKGEAIGPTNAYFGFDSGIGSKEGVRPIAPDGRPIFVSKDGQRVMEISYDLQSDANRAAELSLPAEHLGASGFEEIAWQSAPMRLGWFRCGDGKLVAMVYDPSEEVLGWAPYSVAGGFVEAMAVTPDQSGTYDMLTMVTARTVGGSVVRMVEEQAQNWGVLSGGSPISEAVHLFACTKGTAATPTTNWTVPHLAGERVYVWTESGEYGPLTVAADGLISLPIAVTRACVGLFDTNSLIETLPLQPLANDGSARSRRKRLSGTSGISVHLTAAMKAAAVEYDVGQAAREWGRIDLLPREVAADLSQAYSGTVRAPLASGFCQDVAIRLWPVGGAPATLTGVTPVLNEAGL